MLDFLRRLLQRRAARTSTRQPAETLRHSEEHFARLVAAVRDYAVFLLDRSGNVLSWNAGAERIKGYRAEEVIGQHFSRFYPKEAVSSGWPDHELSVATATGRFEDEGWRLRKDGSPFWASVVITALRDDSGEVRGFLKITRDLTDRKQAEEKLRLSEERFRLLVEGVQDYAIFLVDPEGRVATWNAGAERVKGYAADEIIGQHFSRFYPPEDVKSGQPAREMEIAKATGNFEEEGWRVRKDGTRFWASVALTALRDEGGVLRGFAKVTRDMTERKRAEQDARRLLREEAAREAAEASAREARTARDEERRHREQLHVTLASIGDAVIVTDPKGLITFLNPVAVDLTGWQPQDAVGQPLERVFRIIHEETRRSVENPVAKVLREGTVVGLANHTVLIRRDGREAPIDDSGAPIRGEGGGVAGVVLVFRDVTDARRAAEARLHLAAIVESSDDAIISQNLDGAVTSWNHGAERLYGYAADEVLGRPLAHLAPPDQPDEMPALLERIRRGERIEHYETVRVHKGGDRVEVSLTISPVRNAKGKVVGASKIARDITARKRQEAALRFLAEASKELGELLDVPSTLQRVAGLAVPQFADWCAVDVLEADGSLQRVAVAHTDPSKVDLAWELHRRYPPDPAAPQGVWNVVRTGKSEIAPEISDGLLAATVKDPERLRIARELGLRSYMGVPLAVRSRVLGALTFVATESGRRFDDRDLAVAEDLAQRAAVAIENARLYEAVREAARRKDEFLATLAHELRNPLAPIRNSAALLGRVAGGPGTVGQAREVIERQVTHLARLVDELLDASRIASGKVQLHGERLDLAGVVRSAAEDHRQELGAAGLTLEVDVPASPVWVEGDAVRLTQAMSNLLYNALKFTDRGGRVDVRLTADAAAGRAKVSVRDTGVGMDPEMIGRLFETFSQADQSLDRSKGGLGLGLALVRGLVRLHGGDVRASSGGLGRGSEFTFWLPTAPAPEGQPAGANAAGASGAAASGHILIIEDNRDAADSLRMLLELSGGHAVSVAYTGDEGLEQARASRPEIVLCDLGLPGLSGFEVARALRADPATARIVLVAVTGYGRDEDRRKAREAGFDDLLVKPVEPAALERAVTGGAGRS
jgi:PAS domain S-box-containing protein